MPLAEVWRPAQRDHYTEGRTAPVRYVVIHATGGTNSLDWLTWQSNPPVSCHVLVSKLGVRWRLVSDRNTAWHAGHGRFISAGVVQAGLNECSLGLELENLNDGKDPYPGTQIDSAAYTVAAWLATNPALHIVRHADVDSRKRDPAGFDMAAFTRHIQRHLCRMFSGTN